MSITAIYDKDHKDEKTVNFPFIGIHQEQDIIVLFSSNRQGVVLRTSSRKYYVGYYSSSWQMEGFTPLPEGEKIVMQNNWERGNAE